MQALRRSPAGSLAGAAAATIAAVVAIALVARALAADAPAPGAVHVAVAGSGPAQLRDPRGRSVLLRGVAVTSLIRYGPGFAESPPAGDGDFAEIAALGFDFVRLPVSWSAIEPRPGTIDHGYLSRIALLVGEARHHGLSVLIDMHLDRYNRRLAIHDEADGAPGWATFVPAGCPAEPDPADCQRAGWTGFWQDRPVGGTGLQDHYIAALVAISRRLRIAPNLAGLELMNNPSSGGTPSPQFERTQVWPFYRRAITTLRASGERRPLWLDRAASAEQSNAAWLGLPRIASDRNLVLAPHDYTGVFSSPSWPAGGAARAGRFYATAAAQARAQHAALAVGEWGGPAGGPWDGMLATKLAAQNAAGVGSSFWMFKQRPGFYNWQLVDVNGGLRGDSLRAQILSAPHPDAVPGPLHGFRVAGGALTVPVSGRGGQAVLWSGTQVLAGGHPSLTAPVEHAFVDGRPVAASLAAVGYRSAAVDLRGYRVSVRVPAGRHTLVLR